MPRTKQVHPAVVCAKWVGVVAAVGIVGLVLLIQFFGRWGSGVTEPILRVDCMSNLRSIEHAIYRYYEANGHFPPAFTVDENGRPMHSWRVLLLPFLDQQALYERYDFDQPWDSPHNRALVSKAPRVYCCPGDTEGEPEETNYVMIVGPGAISDGPHWVRREDIADGLGNTILIVETTKTGINWMEPRDLNAQGMSFKINDPNREAIRGNHSACANVMFCDGRIFALDDSVEPGVIKAMSTIAGGEDVSCSLLQEN